MANERASAIPGCGLLIVAACGGSSPPLDVTVTAYCLDGVTKSGAVATEGSIAADPGVLPLGSVVRIEGLAPPHNGRYTVTDTGAAIKGRRVDIFMSDCAEARRFGRQDGRLRVLELEGG